MGVAVEAHRQSTQDRRHRDPEESHPLSMPPIELLRTRHPFAMRPDDGRLSGRNHVRQSTPAVSDEFAKLYEKVCPRPGILSAEALGDLVTPCTE